MRETVYTLEEIRAILAPIAQKYAIPAIYVFGTYARRDARPDSDIDLLVDTHGTHLNSLLALGALYAELEAAFGKRVDLITVDSLEQAAMMPSELRFRETVLRERVNVYAAA